MAEIDVTGLSVKLKETKKYIDDLRGSMIQLINEGKDTAQVEEQIRNEQEKLNKVMKIGKKETDYAAGSWNALNEQFKKAQKEYKALGKAAREGADGIKKLAEVNNLRQQLADIEESMGDFRRNVGNYANSIEQAFKKGFSGLGGVEGKLGEIIGTIKQLVPLIKSASTAGVAGTKAVGVAMNALPFMAIITAITLIISNLDKIREAIWGINSATEEMNKREDKLNEKIDEERWIMGKVVERMKARGDSEKQILQYKQKTLKAMRVELLAELQALYVEYQRIDAHSTLRKMISGEDKQLEEIVEKGKEIAKQIKALDREIAGLKFDEETFDKYGDKGKNDKRSKEQKSFIDETLKRLKDFGKSELQILKDDYEAQSKLLEDEYKKNPKKKKEYEEAMTKLTAEYAQKRQEILQGEIDLAIETIDRLNKLFNSDYDTQKIEETYETSKAALTKAMNTELELYGKTEEDKKRITEKYNQLFDQLEQERILNHQKNTDKMIEGDLALADKTQKELRDKALMEENHSYDMSDDKSSEAQIKHIEKVWQIQDAYFKWYIEEQFNLLESENITAEEKDKIRERLHQAQVKRLELEYKKDVDVKKATVKQEKKSWKEITQIASQGIQAISGLMNGLIGLWQDDIKAKQENGEISEEEARKSFERTKKVQLGLALMQVAGGVTAALAGLFTTKSGPWDYALAIIQAASIAAAGAVQIAQISRQTYDSAGSGGGANNPIVIPPMAQYSETNVVNPTERDSIDSLNETLKNQTVVVKITDVEKVQNRKKASVSESSW